MKILFLCKRRPQCRDLIDRPYGRFYHLPGLLAERGHEVHLLLLSHKNDSRISMQRDKMNWTSISILRHGPLAYLHEAKKIISRLKPEVIGGFSDTYYGIMAQRLGEKYHIPSLIDAYDNFESYIPWMKPLHALWRNAISKASLVTAAGPGLADLLGKSRPGKPVKVIPMAADAIFQPMDKVGCREKLGLPKDKKLIGFSGSTIHKSRGPEVLFRAFNLLKENRSDIDLVLTGRKGPNITIPSDVNWLGYIPDEHMPLLMNSLDVLVVLNRLTAFGNFSYPVKLYEAMACCTPIVATGTASTRWILRGSPELLVEADNANELGRKIESVLNLDKVDYEEQMNWQQLAAKFEETLLRDDKLSI